MRRLKLSLALALVALGALPAVASAGHWWFVGSGPAIVHVGHAHNASLSLYNKGGTSWEGMEHARGDWSGRSWAMDIHNWASQSAHIVSWDGWWGNTGWRGQTTLYGWWDGQHTQQMGIQLNLSYLPDYINIRKTACHELGHAAVGMQHYQEDGCMMSGTPVTTNQRYPSAHDVWHADTMWGSFH